MSRKWVYGLTLVVMILSGVVLGTMSGSLLHHVRHEAEASSQREQVQEFLESKLVGIAVGSGFPEVPLSKSDGAPAPTIKESLPEGGLILYITTSCESCFHAVSALSRALATREAGKNHVLIIAIGEADPALEYLSRENITIDVVFDDKRVLASEHGLLAYPVLFMLSQDQIITAIQAEARTEDLFTQFLDGSGL